MVAEKIFMVEKILVAVDESEVSQQIFTKALSLAMLGHIQTALLYLRGSRGLSHNRMVRSSWCSSRYTSCRIH